MQKTLHANPALSFDAWRTLCLQHFLPLAPDLMLSAQTAAARGSSATPGVKPSMATLKTPLLLTAREEGSGRRKGEDRGTLWRGKTVVDTNQDVTTTILPGVCSIREEDAVKGTSQGVPDAGSLLGREEGAGLLRAQTGQGEVGA